VLVKERIEFQLKNKTKQNKTKQNTFLERHDKKKKWNHHELTKGNFLENVTTSFFLNPLFAIRSAKVRLSFALW
jgi:hypothetical protein